MTVKGACPLCGVRKARRQCPALGRMICTVCCGTKRLTEIPCPDECPYLATSRNHPAAVVQRRQERDLRFFLPLVAELTEPQSRLVLLFQSVIVRHAAAALPPVLDLDIADAAAAVAATLDTARQGLIYEHRPSSVPAQQLAAALRAALAAIAPEPSQAARLERDTVVALRRIEQGARSAGDVLAGDEPPIFLGLIRRLVSEAGGAQDESRVERPGGTVSGRPLIIPG